MRPGPWLPDGSPNPDFVPWGPGEEPGVIINDERPGVVYLVFGQDGGVEYVGTTVDLLVRMRAHELYTPWWPVMVDMEVEEWPRRSMAHARERDLIRRLDPPRNKYGAPHYERHRARTRAAIAAERRARAS